jgi:hypothetical protein
VKRRMGFFISAVEGVTRSAVLSCALSMTVK